MDEKEALKVLEEYVKHMPKKKAMCYLKDCLSCTEFECENKAIINDYLNELNQAYARINSPISAYVETEKLPR